MVNELNRPSLNIQVKKLKTLKNH